MNIKNFSGGYSSAMKDMEGKIVTIEKQTKTWKGELAYKIEEDKEGFVWDERAFESYNIKPTQEELLELPIGTKITTDLKDEDNVFIKLCEDYFTNGELECLTNFEIKNDLSIKNKNCGTKITKIEVPTYETFYDNLKEVKEMTVAEISKALGYEVKIVREEE